MSGQKEIPKFMEGRALPAGYFKCPNPYADPEPSFIDLQALYLYAVSRGKEITDVTPDEAAPFFTTE